MCGIVPSDSAWAVREHVDGGTSGEKFLEATYTCIADGVAHPTIACERVSVGFSISGKEIPDFPI